MKERHFNKKVAPVIVSLCLIGYYVLVIFGLYKISIPNLFKIMVFIVSVIITFVIIRVLIERIKEINGGEEDDLGEY